MDSEDERELWKEDIYSAINETYLEMGNKKKLDLDDNFIREGFLSRGEARSLINKVCGIYRLESVPGSYVDLLTPHKLIEAIADVRSRFSWVREVIREDRSNYEAIFGKFTTPSNQPAT